MKPFHRPYFTVPGCFSLVASQPRGADKTLNTLTTSGTTLLCAMSALRKMRSTGAGCGRIIIGTAYRKDGSMTWFTDRLAKVRAEPDHDCPCCGESFCDCRIQQIEGSDPSVGYYEIVDWCVVHDRKVD